MKGENEGRGGKASDAQAGLCPSRGCRSHGNNWRTLQGDVTFLPEIPEHTSVGRRAEGSKAGGDESRKREKAAPGYKPKAGSTSKKCKSPHLTTNQLNLKNERGVRRYDSPSPPWTVACGRCHDQFLIAFITRDNDAIIHCC